MQVTTADIYGLLLPEKMHAPFRNTTCNAVTSRHLKVDDKPGHKNSSLFEGSKEDSPWITLEYVAKVRSSKVCDK